MPGLPFAYEVAPTIRSDRPIPAPCSGSSTPHTGCAVDVGASVDVAAGAAVAGSAVSASIGSGAGVGTPVGVAAWLRTASGAIVDVGTRP